MTSETTEPASSFIRQSSIVMRPAKSFIRHSSLVNPDETVENQRQFRSFQVLTGSSFATLCHFAYKNMQNLQNLRIVAIDILGAGAYSVRVFPAGCARGRRYSPFKNG